MIPSKDASAIIELLGQVLSIRNTITITLAIITYKKIDISNLIIQLTDKSKKKIDVNNL